MIPKLEEARNGNLVHFVNSTFAGLPHVSVTLPNGERMNLEGNVSLLHENSSMTVHSRVPEHDIVEACRTLAPGGVYFVPSTDISNVKARSSAVAGEAVQRAHEAINEQFGMELSIDQRWKIFRRPDEVGPEAVLAVSEDIEASPLEVSDYKLALKQIGVDVYVTATRV